MPCVVPCNQTRLFRPSPIRTTPIAGQGLCWVLWCKSLAIQGFLKTESKPWHLLCKQHQMSARRRIHSTHSPSTATNTPLSSYTPTLRCTLHCTSDTLPNQALNVFRLKFHLLSRSQLRAHCRCNNRSILLRNMDTSPSFRAPLRALKLNDVPRRSRSAICRDPRIARVALKHVRHAIAS
jgi:hypothetical protein